MIIKSFVSALCLAAGFAQAGIVHYNFEGVITLTDSIGIVSDGAQAAKVGQKVNAIYSVDDSSTFSGSNGSQLNMQFDYAILNYAYYIGGKLVVSDKYRINRLQFAKGWVNGSPTDFIDFTLDGGRDNYNNDYGQNAFGEYVDSYLYMADSTATVFNDLKYSTRIPASLDFNRFDLGVFDVSGTSGSGGWFARHNITGIRIDTNVTSAVTSPLTSTLFGVGLLGLWLRRRSRV